MRGERASSGVSPAQGRGGGGRASLPPTPGMLKRRINRASVEEGFPLPCLSGRTDGPPLAAWDLQAEEWFSRANRKCRVGARCRWVLAEQRDPAAAEGGAMDALRQRLAAARRG